MSNGNRVMPTLVRPGCMGEDEWRLWSQSNANTAGNRAKSPCADCPFEFLVARAIDGTCGLVTIAEKATTERGECRQ